MANLDAQSLLTDARCLACNGGLSEAEALKLQLLATIVANGGVSPVVPPCVPPNAPAGLSVSTFTATSITLSISLSILDPIPSSYVIKWGTTLGGPYPNSKSTNNSGFQTLTTADGLVAGTTYYFVVYSFTGCISTSSSPEASGNLTDAIATDWATRVVANGGVIPSQANINAFSTFITTLKAAGLWTKMIMVNGFAPDNLTAARTPLLVGGSTDPWPGTPNNAGFTLSASGINGNATHSFSTGFIPSTAFANDLSAGISLIDATWVNGGNLIECGVYMQSNNNSFMLVCDQAGVLNADAWDVSNGRMNRTPPRAAGFYSFSRVSAVDQKAFFGKTGTPLAQIGATLATAGGSHTNVTANFAVLAINSAPSGNQSQCTRTMSFLLVHLGLTLAETTTLMAACYAVRTTFGGGAP